MAPAFAGLTAWTNTPGRTPLTLSGLRGKVILVDFWTFSCINCQRTLPHVKAWYRDYAKRGLEVAGVHTPEFAYEHEIGNVRKPITDLGITYPVALDNDYATWNQFHNSYWPAVYLVDRAGHIRYEHFGEHAYGETEHDIQALLAEAPT
jgi:thiol-disulfide isomerase/thioredoxin